MPQSRLSQTRTRCDAKDGLMMPARVVVLLFGLLVGVLMHSSVAAETYRDISPVDTLGDVKKKLPNGTFARLNPAWAQPSDVMYRISGFGLSGTIVVKFSDSRPNWKAALEKEETETAKEIYRKLANESEDDALKVDWVRWVPLQPIPLARFIAKYGHPEETGFSDEDLEPYRRWAKRGLVGYLSNDEKNVTRVDFNFT